MYLRRYRKLNKIKMEELAQEIGVCAPTISKIESCIAFPRPDVMHKISIFTNGQVSPNDFVDRWISVNGVK